MAQFVQLSPQSEVRMIASDVASLLRQVRRHIACPASLVSVQVSRSNSGSMSLQYDSALDSMLQASRRRKGSHSVCCCHCAATGLAPLSLGAVHEAPGCLNTLQSPLLLTTWPAQRSTERRCRRANASLWPPARNVRCFAPRAAARQPGRTPPCPVQDAISPQCGKLLGDNEGLTALAEVTAVTRLYSVLHPAAVHS
jgi:hypothetical protein